MSDPHTLYGSSLSLYSGRARSYLIQLGVPYREVLPNTAHFVSEILPQAGQFSIPIVETADGQVFRDGAAIIDHFEAQAGHPCRPPTPNQHLISLLFDVIGCEGLLRPAMHYRWNFPEENLDFLTFHFATLLPQGTPPERAEANMNRMRAAAQAFGVTEASHDLIEGLYRQLLSCLDRHFAVWPYLLGHRPSIGDFGLMAPMYGHLGRDPKPLALMQAQAVRLFRWVERMNRPEPDIGEFVKDGEVPAAEFAPGDEIPQTLRDLLRHIAMDFVPETVAAADTINRWLESESDLAPGTAIQRGVGMTSFEIAGEPIQALAQPYRFFLLQRFHDGFDELSDADQGRFRGILKDCDLLSILDARLHREIGRKDNLEVWL